MKKILHLLNLFMILVCLPISAQFTLNLPSLSADCGDIIQIPVTVENFDSLVAAQFTVTWDVALLDFVENTEEVVAIDFNARLNSIFAKDGTLIFQWESMQELTLSQGDTLFIFSLQVQSGTATTSDIQFSNENAAISIRNIAGGVTPILNTGTISLLGNNSEPVIVSCPDTVFQYTTDLACTAIGEWAAPVFQSCSGELEIVASTEMGSVMEIGSRLITYTATDESGRSVACSFVHLVQDTIAPVISNCPDNFEVNFSTEAGCDLSVDWSAPSFLERCSSTETMISSNFNSGDNFPVGKTLVTYSATDAASNTSSCSFEVIVTGSDPITFQERPENITITAEQGLCGASYDWGGPPMAISGCAPVNLVTNIQSGSFFPVGVTVVEYVATDQINQRAVWSFSVTVKDEEPLAARCPIDITVDASGHIQSDEMDFLSRVITDNCGEYQLFFNDIEVIDNCAAKVARTLLTGSETNFSTGITQMEYLIENESGETATCNFMINILETPAITITRSAELACVETDLSLMAATDNANFYYDTWEWTGPNNFASLEQNPIIPLTPQSSGLYKVIASSSTSGCTAENTTDIEVFGLPGEPVVEAERLVVCEGESISFNTIAENGATYEWTGPNDFNTEDIAINFDQADRSLTGNYQLTRTAEGCTSAPVDVRVIVLSSIDLTDDVVNTFINNEVDFEVLTNDSFEVDAPFTLTTFPETVNGRLLNNGDGTFSYLPNEDFVGVDQLSYEICYDACPDLCASSILTIRTAISDERCTFPTYLSPNGDEANETLIFPCNDSNNANGMSSITIFNQYGAIVYQAAPYNNDWQGTYKDQPLPDGTYFYIYNAYLNDPEPVKNCVTIFR